ncbi:MAG: hypothetical protein Q9165_003657 [Trypethelium subeluteriae]
MAIKRLHLSLLRKGEKDSERLYESARSTLLRLFRSKDALPTDINDRFSNGRLSQAIARQDESECREVLYRDAASINERNQLGQTPLHISIIWAAGIAMLLDAGSDPYVFDSMGRSPLTYMCHTFRTRHLSETQVLGALDLFLDQDIPVPCEAWSCKGEDDSMATERWRGAMARIFHLDPIVSKHLVRALKARRGRLHTTALQVLPVHTLELLNIASYNVPDINVGAICASLRQFGIMIPRALWGPSLQTTVYHAIASARSAAPSMHLDTLYELDFRDFDEVDHNGLSPLAGIAVMQPWEWQTVMDYRINDVQHPQSDLDVASWLIRKGADMTLSTSDPRLCSDRQHILEPGEVQEIGEEERYTIAQLEILMTEFEMKYEELALKIEDFLVGYWDERMIEVLAVAGPLELVESHKEAAAKIGVFLS